VKKIEATFIRFEKMNVTDRQIDRRTDGRTDGRIPHRPHLCIASRGKKLLKMPQVNLARSAMMVV